MPYAKIDDRFADSDTAHDVLEENPDGLAAYLLASSKVAGEATDGVVRRRWIRQWFGEDRAERACATLVRHGLFAPHEDGWEIVGWLDRNISADEWRERQAKERAKKRRQRARGGSSPGASPQSVPRGRPGGTSDQTRPDQTRQEESAATTTDAAGNGRRRSGPAELDSSACGSRSLTGADPESRGLPEVPAAHLAEICDLLGDGDWATADRREIARVLAQHPMALDRHISAAVEAVEYAALPMGAPSRINSRNGAVALRLRLQDHQLDAAREAA